jgi:hypothetical protein
MKTTGIILIIIALLLNISCQTAKSPDDVWSYAQKRKSDLQLGVYIIAQTVEQMFTTETGRREAISVLKCNGITKVYLEVYRSGLVVKPELLKSSADFLKSNGFEVVGGIATVPGPNFGVPQEGPLTWFNWQNPKTQNDLRKVMEDAAPIFNKFIVDDFLCTADTSLESKAAKGDKSWSEYRRALLTELSKSVFINPAKASNPNIQIVIKYPQWYDRFHLFGYDLATEPALYDGVWVGTETRGQYTQRYGFVQPYEGFINYRWISTLSGNKIGGAWFDHGDCTDVDFIEQAYQSVLAGAKELVMFNFDSFVAGHPGHHLLRNDFETLANLAAEIAMSPVQGAVGYKPVNSNAGGDLYIMDYIGMLGISLVPASSYPKNAKVVFLPTQAATDLDIYSKVNASLAHGSKIIMTSGFIANAKDGDKLAQLAGIKWPITLETNVAESIVYEGVDQKIAFPLTMDYQVVPEQTEVLLLTSGAAKNPYFLQNHSKKIYVLNSHTFNQKDFDAVGEVLLSPRQLGILELPKPWANTIRTAFRSEDEPVIDAPTRVSVQHLNNGSFVVHNYNQVKTIVTFTFPKGGDYFDGFTGSAIQVNGTECKLEMAPRSRIWFNRK